MTMAKKGRKGLYLPLRIDLQQWEKDLAAADADLKEKIKELRSEAARVKLQYDVQIANADAAGDQMRKFQLQQAKLNQLIEIQTTKVRGLEAAWQKEVATSGAASAASEKLARSLAYEQIYLAKLKKDMNGMNAGFGTKLADTLSSISPTFAAIRSNVNMVISTFGSLSSYMKGSFGKNASEGLAETASSVGAVATAAKAAGLSLGSLGTAAAVAGVALTTGVVTGATGAYYALSKARDAVVEYGKEAANASEPVFELAERMGLAYEESSKLSGIFAIDGTNYEAYVRALQRFNKSLQGNSEAAKEAREFLKYYGVELQDAAGRQLSIEQQTKNLAKAFNSIADEGEKLDFLVKVLGTAGTQYAHLFKGMDDYIAKEQQVNIAQGADVERMHEILTLNNQLKLGYDRLKMAREGIYTESTISIMQEQVKQLEREANLIKGYTADNIHFADAMGKLGIAVEKTDGDFKSLWETMKNFGKRGVVSIMEAIGVYDSKAADAERKQKAVQKIVDDAFKATEQQKKAAADAERKRAADEAKEKEKAEKKLVEVRKKFYAELDAVSQSSYEREIQQIEDKKQKYIEEGMAASEAQKLYDAEKAKIDAKYQQQEQNKYQQQVQAARNAYDQIDAIYMTSMQKQIANIEKQKQAWIKAGVDEVTATRAAMKQIQEARLQDNESTLRSNVDIIKKARREYESGNQNWMEATKAFADKKWMQGMGINMADLNFFKNMGADIFKELGNASSRMLGDMGGNVTNNNNNTVNVNMSDMMFEDESTMNKFLEKLAGKLIPVLEKAAGVSTGQQAATNNY